MDYQCAKIRKSGERTSIQGFKNSRIQRFKDSKKTNGETSCLCGKVVKVRIPGIIPVS